MYAKTKELGPTGGVRRHAPPRSAYDTDMLLLTNGFGIRVLTFLEGFFLGFGFLIAWKMYVTMPIAISFTD